MPITRAQFRALVRETLPDRSQWPDATLNAWIEESIHDYSTFFPNTAETSLLTTPGRSVYSLADCTGITGVLAVVYPARTEPNAYLWRLSEKSARFPNGPYYDLRGDPPVELVLAREVIEDEIRVTYATCIAGPAEEDAPIPVRDEHLEALKLYVQWQAIKELELLESLAPGSHDLSESMLGLNAARAERVYRQRLRDYQSFQAPGGYIPPWPAAPHEPVY